MEQYQIHALTDKHRRSTMVRYGGGIIFPTVSDLPCLYRPFARRASGNFYGVGPGGGDEALS